MNESEPGEVGPGAEHGADEEPPTNAPAADWNQVLAGSRASQEPVDPTARDRRWRTRDDAGLRAEWKAHEARLAHLGVTPPQDVDLVVRGAVDGALSVWIPPGPFTMGSDERVDERPVREVVLDAFYMDILPVTRARFADFLGRQERSDAVGDDGLEPMVDVSWEEAQAYCAWAGKRLPTEAQWEKGARGPDGRRYPWGSDYEIGRAAVAAAGLRGAAPVATFGSGASPYGLQDLAGNVWEWVADWYDGSAYSRGGSTNPSGPTSGSRRVVRGGSWVCHPSLLRCTARHSQEPAYRSRFVGFRCVR